MRTTVLVCIEACNADKLSEDIVQIYVYMILAAVTCMVFEAKNELEQYLRSMRQSSYLAGLGWHSVS